MSKYVKINGKLVEVKDEDVLDTKPTDAEVADTEVEAEEEEAKSFGRKIAKDILGSLSIQSDEVKELREKLDKLVNEKYPANSKLKKLLNGKDIYSKTEELTKEEKIIAFFYAAVTQDKAALKALSNVDADGGYTVPQELLSEIVRDIANINVLRNVVRVIPMRRDTLDVTTLVSGIDVFYTGENVAKSTTTARFGRVTLTAYKVAAIIYSSDELLEDSDADLVSLIVQMFAEKIANKEEEAIMVGNGTTQPQGIETARAASTIASIATVGTASGDALIDAFYTLPRQYHAKASWIMTPLAARVVRKLKDTTGQYLWQVSIQAGEPDLLLGKPVFISNWGGPKTAYFGDFKRGYFFGDRKRMTVKVSNDTETAFTKDQTAIRVVSRFAGRVVLPNAIRAVTNLNG
jgi:HK97 family phage major capsid protein